MRKETNGVGCDGFGPELDELVPVWVQDVVREDGPALYLDGELKEEMNRDPTCQRPDICTSPSFAEHVWVCSPSSSVSRYRSWSSRTRSSSS